MKDSDKIEKTDEMFAHILFIEGILSKYFNIDSAKADKCLDDIRKQIKKLKQED